MNKNREQNREQNDLALNQKSIKIKFCKNRVNSDLKMIQAFTIEDKRNMWSMI